MAAIARCWGTAHLTGGVVSPSSHHPTPRTTNARPATAPSYTKDRWGAQAGLQSSEFLAGSAQLRQQQQKHSQRPPRRHASKGGVVASSTNEAPLLVRAARQEAVERAPAWMMRQAGRYMAAYKDLTKKHPSFRERSETTDLIVEISLQPWNAFRPDGVILFSDILTPLPAVGIPFDIDETKGPLIDSPIRTKDALAALQPIDLDRLTFVGDALKTLHKEVAGQAAVLGFVGSPWTLATYIVEGRSTRTYKVIKAMTFSDPDVLRPLLDHLATEIGKYMIYQIEAGADCIQIFDSWGGQLPPRLWDQWSKPYIQKAISIVRAAHPSVPLVLYANGSGGLLERMATVGVDVIGLDWTIDMEDGRRRLGPELAVQGNVDPAVLFATPQAITEAIEDTIRKAGPKGHILNLGHGVLVGTPEERVAHFFDTNRNLKYSQ